MLPEIAAEAMHFLSRRDLDKAFAVSKWLDAMIAHCGDVYPLRSVQRVELRPVCNGFSHMVSIDAGGVSQSERSFNSVDEAAHFIGCILCHSYVEYLEVGYYDGARMSLFTDHWITLMDALRSGAVQRLQFTGIDFSAIDKDIFLAAVGVRGLKSLGVQLGVCPSGFVVDDLIRHCGAKGLPGLCFLANDGGAPNGLSEEAVLEFFFPANSTPGGQFRYLLLEGTGMTDLLYAKFLERLESSPVRPSGYVEFRGAVKQRGLSAYARYLMPGGMDDDDDEYAIYRLPSDDERNPYEVEVCEHTLSMSIRFCNRFHR